MRSNATILCRILLVGLLLSCSSIRALTQTPDAQSRAQALKAKIRQIVLDESTVKMNATLTMDTKAHIELQTKFENLKSEVQTKARAQGFAAGDTLIVIVNAESLDYSFRRAMPEAPAKGVLVKTPARMVDAHQSLVDAIVITSDAQTLLTGSTDNTVKLWSLPQARLEATLLNGKKSAVHYGPMAVNADGTILASAGEKYSARLWSVPEGRLLATLEGHTNFIRAIAITPDAKVVATGGQDNTIKLWSVPDGRLLYTLRGHSNYVNGLAITPDGKILISASSDATISLWSLPEGQLIKTLTGHHGNVHTVAITPDGKMLASGSLDNTIRLWSLPEGQQLHTLVGHADWVNVVKISPDGKVVASGAEDIRLWSLSDGKPLATLKAPGDPIKALAFAANGKMLISTHAGRLLFWDIGSAL